MWLGGRWVCAGGQVGGWMCSCLPGAGVAAACAAAAPLPERGRYQTPRSQLPIQQDKGHGVDAACELCPSLSLPPALPLVLLTCAQGSLLDKQRQPRRS